MMPIGLFQDVYRDTRVFLTGNTGFKGSWLHLWLESLGADVTGFSLAPPSEPNHFSLLDLKGKTITRDLRNRDALIRAMQEAKPEIVFHLAAQSLVRRSYAEAAETFETNVLGTVNLFEACKSTPSVRAIVNITSDKCYKQRETDQGYVETDPMGGHDPYSCSKGCAELITASYRSSFFAVTEPPTLLASVRAGNVIGGGDWGEDRLVPDIMRDAAQGTTTLIRSPHAVRPWQHVLEPLCGYLQLGRMLLEGNDAFAAGWNFGPKEEHALTVREVAEAISTHWPNANFEMATTAPSLHEATLLRLDPQKSMNSIGWQPAWSTQQGIQETVRWYRNFYEQHEVISRDQLDAYVAAATQLKLPWTGNNA